MITGPTRTYYSTFFDSARWLEFETRPDDVIVATPYKAGTTWTQNIVLHLIHRDLKKHDISTLSPWLDRWSMPFEEARRLYEVQDHRRVIKTHLPFDGLPFDDALRYIVVGRDPRDIFMSLWNFYRNFGEDSFAPRDDPRIMDLARPPDSILDFWDDWISKGALDGEGDGYPFWSCFRQIQTWWDERHRENILFLHYADMLAAPRAHVARIARFLDIELSPDLLDAITEITSFASMKRDASVIDTGAEEHLKGGAASFINKGTNGRWRTVLDAARLDAYDRRAAETLSPDCRHWMENGGAVPGAGS